MERKFVEASALPNPLEEHDDRGSLSREIDASLFQHPATREDRPQHQGHLAVDLLWQPHFEARQKGIATQSIQHPPQHRLGNDVCRFEAHRSWLVDARDVVIRLAGMA